MVINIIVWVKLPYGALAGKGNALAARTLKTGHCEKGTPI
jgi:hypothetical protein